GWLARMDLSPLIFREQWEKQPARTRQPDEKPSWQVVPTVTSGKKRVTLLRHASTLENEQRRYIGSTDSPLSKSGKQDAEQLTLHLAKQRFDRIWYSPMLRAKQTLAGLGNVAGERCALSDLREIDFGHWEGQTYEELQQNVPHEIERWNREGEGFSFPGGEAIASFHQRIDHVARHIADDDSESLLIVTHGGVIRHLVCRLLGLPISQSFSFKVSPASVTTIEMQGGNAVLTSLNVTPTGKR
ncbi:MAG: histidine phosphatase family protein, partial [Pirellulales bacterium]|nr:histidine phosphatase family protein [Pirellulales bacterium]